MYARWLARLSTVAAVVAALLPVWLAPSPAHAQAGPVTPPLPSLSSGGLTGTLGGTLAPVVGAAQPIVGAAAQPAPAAQPPPANAAPASAAAPAAPSVVTTNGTTAANAPGPTVAQAISAPVASVTNAVAGAAAP